MTRTSPTRRTRRRLAGLVAVVTIAAAGLLPVTSVLAADPPNMVLVWNENAVNVISQPGTNTPPGLGQGPPLAALHVAMVHGAIYDAVNAIDGGHEPYLPGLSAPSTASQAAAVAQAAHDVLYGITPAANTAVRTRIDALLTASLALIDPSQAKTDGIEIGADAAAAMLAARASDGRFDVEPFIPSNDVGKWRLVPPLNANVQGQFATVTPLTLKSPDQFQTEGMPAVTSAQYAAEFNEVKALGAQSGSSRTDAQTLTAGFFTANPLFFYNTGLRGIATDEGLSTSEQARLFAKTSMAGADALIGCWNNKKFWYAWRPQTAIHEAANDGNPLTEPDAELDVALRGTGLPGRAVRLQLLHGRVLAERPVLLRHRQVFVLADESRGTGQPGRGKSNWSRWVDQDLQPVHRCHRRHDRRTDPQRVPLPDGRRQWRLDRQEGRPVDRQALLRGRRLTPRRTTNGRPGSPQAGRFRCSVTRPPVLPGWTMGKNTAGSPPRGP